MIQYRYHDGGRAAAGFKGSAGDCFARAVAIATQLPYRMIYDKTNELASYERMGSRKQGISDARTGVYKTTAHKFMAAIGWVWVPTMFIGSGCKVHLRAEELPKGPLVLALSKHFAAVVGGILYDTGDCSREGRRCVYGYWRPPGSADLARK